MITPPFGLTATERVLPRLALDFTTATLDPRVTFTRAGNTATYTNSSGVITAINANLPRFDYNPTTLTCQGLLIEETRTNVLLNSLIDGTNLSTQSVTTTAAARTLSFYGSGQVVLSGTHSATVVGAGDYPARKTYTFTPTAGTLTLTVTGDVKFAQLELGVFATSFIPTDSTAGGITRNIDVASMTGTNFSSWYNQTGSTIVCEYDSNIPPNVGTLIGWVWAIADGTSTSTSSIIAVQDRARSNSMSLFYSETGGGLDINTSIYAGASYGKTCAAFNPGEKPVGAAKGRASVIGSVNQQAMTATLLTFGTLNDGANAPINGHIKKFYYYPQKLTNAEVQAFSKE